MNNYKKGSAVVAVIIIIVLILIVAGVYFYIKNRPETLNDSNLQISEPVIPQAENSAFSLASTAPLSISTSSALSMINAVAQEPYFYCHLTDSIYTLCNLTSVRTIANLAIAQTDVLYKQGNIDSALTGAFNVLDLGQKIENDSDAFIVYLVGSNIKQTALTEIQAIVQSGKLDSVDEALYKQKLGNDSNDLTGETNTIKFEYEDAIARINDITTGTYNPAFWDSKEEFDSAEKSKNSNTWNSSETKQMVYYEYSKLLSQVNLPCGSTYQLTAEDTALTSPNPQAENFIGKTYFGGALASFHDLSNSTSCKLIPFYQSITASLSTS